MLTFVDRVGHGRRGVRPLMADTRRETECRRRRRAITGGGYPVAPGATRPDPGTCRSGLEGCRPAPSPGSRSSPAPSRGSATRRSSSRSIGEKNDFHLGTVTIQNGAERV